MIKLGKTYQDKISGFEGVAVARTDWLYGCVRITLQPKKLHDGKPVDSSTFDEPQLVEVAEEPIKAPKGSRGGPRSEPVRQADPAR
jgi:hypothetical protein